MREPDKGRVQTVHPFAWLWEPLEPDPSFVLRTMFGTKAVYILGKLTLCFAARTEPWRGVLVCTDKDQHAALCHEMTALAPHPVLPKWLYLPEASTEFDAIAQRLVRLVRQRDPRIGIVPAHKKTRAALRRFSDRP